MGAKSFYNILLTFFLSVTIVNAQDSTYYDNPSEETYYDEASDDYEVLSRVFLIGLSLHMLQPLDHFMESNQSLKYGIDFQILAQLFKEKGFILGFDTGYNVLESSGGSFIEIDQGYQRDINWRTNTSLIPLLIDMRYYLDVFWWKFEPYVEGFAGGNLLYTNTNYNDVNDTDYSDSDLHKIVFTPAIGLGVGMHFVINTLQGEYNKTYLDCRVRYLQGFPASYYIVDNPYNTSLIGIDNFKLTNSQTNILTYDIGLVFKF